MSNSTYSARSIYKKMRISPRKLGLVADLIRGTKVSYAFKQLSFSKKRIAHSVQKCLQSAVSNAEHNYGYDIDRLVVSEVTVGKSLVLKRVKFRARGRANRINKFFSNLYITVKEV